MLHGQRLANALDAIASGQWYSASALQTAIEHLEKLRADWKSKDPEIDPLVAQRLFESIIACKSALLGWTGGSHEIQDAARFIRQFDQQTPAPADKSGKLAAAPLSQHP